MKTIIWKILSIIILITAIFAIGYRFLEAETLISKVYLLGYFTIQSNLIVIVVVALSLFNIRLNREWEMTVVTAISITALIFQVFLKSYINPTGLNNIIANMNHGSTTILFIFWFLSAPVSKNIELKKIFKALIYPSIYCVFGVLENLITGNSRYFFLDVKTLGWSGFMLWFLGLATIFLLVTYVIIKADHINNKLRNNILTQ